MIQQLTLLQEEALLAFENAKTFEEIGMIETKFQGKNGILTEILKKISQLSLEEKQTIGKFSNELKNKLQQASITARKRVQDLEIEQALASQFQDVTGTISQNNQPHIHPLTRVIRLVEESMMRMGFEIEESFEVTTEYLNFDAVNVPKNHPARDMQDTFWLSGEGRVLATQTSSMQNLIMKNHPLPIRVAIPGRVFRNEDVDATHENTFYQVEAIVIDKGIHMGNLKYTISTMLSDMFDAEVKIRLRPSYYPFVEPGADVDFSCPFCKGEGCRICKKTGWIEFMGCGMIHPKVLQEAGIDSNEYTGFAFGFGLNRLAMIKYGINHMKYYMNPNIDFLKQF